MLEYRDVVPSGHTFAERVGAPDELSSAIGQIAMRFSELDEHIARAIHKMLELDEDTGAIVTSEMSFKNKVHLMASLVQKLSLTRRFNAGTFGCAEMLREHVARCFRAEDLRNQTMHSSWVQNYLREDEAVRRKITAKAKHGLNIQSERVDSGHLLDIADFICTVGAHLEEFFIDVADEETT